VLTRRTHAWRWCRLDFAGCIDDGVVHNINIQGKQFSFSVVTRPLLLMCGGVGGGSRLREYKGGFGNPQNQVSHRRFILQF